jgi:hypothetical protein
MHSFSEIVPSRFCVYSEYVFNSPSKEWGDGLLDKRLSRQKPISVTRPISRETTIELFGFGTGVFASQVKVNDCELDFPVLGEDTSPPYPAMEGASINRAYHRTRVPADVIREGLNTIELPPTHAYVQCLALRLYEEDPNRAMADLQLPTSSLRVTENTEHSSCTVELSDLKNESSLETVDILAYYTGYDENMNGEQRDWHGGAEPDEHSTSGYALYGHAGNCSAIDPSLEFDVTFIPDPQICFRSRLKDGRGYVVESPDGFSNIELGKRRPIHLIRPEGFLATGFHEHGWNQANGSRTMSFKVPAELASHKSILRYAGYGEWRILLNGQVVKENTNLPLARCLQDSVCVSPVVGENILTFETIGGTGCFQNPGPLLYITED